MANHVWTKRIVFFAGSVTVCVVVAGILAVLTRAPDSGRIVGKGSDFSGEKSFELIGAQLAFGPRFVGSPGHARVRDFIEQELRAYTPHITVQEFDHTPGEGMNMRLNNILARFNPEQSSRVILATHYDTQPTAFRDSLHPEQGVPGANNGASGVAVLLEIARVLSGNPDTVRGGVDLVFFDGEEGEEGVNSDTWRPLGSEYFATHLEEFYKTQKPIAAIVIDMVCEKGMKIPRELTTLRDAPALADTFWDGARDGAPNVFLERTGYAMRDDHTPLAAAGIPSLLLIDFDYPWNYTLSDTADKCSPASVQAVGDALLAYLRTL